MPSNGSTLIFKSMVVARRQTFDTQFLTMCGARAGSFGDRLPKRRTDVGAMP